MAYVYRHIRLDKNEPFYIGIGSDDRYYRANAKAHRNKVWKGIVSRTEYKVDILVDNITYDYAKEKEIEFIMLYGRINLGTGTLCNLTNGGDGTIGQVFTKEHREKLSKSQKGKRLTDEHRRKLRESGRDWSLTDQQKMSISKKLKGRKKDPNKCAKGIDNGRSKIILDIDSGVYYTSIFDLSKTLGINQATIRYNLQNKKYTKYIIT